MNISCSTIHMSLGFTSGTLTFTLFEPEVLPLLFTQQRTRGGQALGWFRPAASEMAGWGRD